eukprot:31105-Pelagococcus_subviridis.AAC.21
MTSRRSPPSPPPPPPLADGHSRAMCPRLPHRKHASSPKNRAASLPPPPPRLRGGVERRQGWS